MESELDPRTAVRVAQRAGAAPYLDYPPTPWWFAPTVGLWAAALVMTISGLGDHKAVFIPILVLLIAAEGAFFAWYRHYRGTWPSLRGAPAELRRPMLAYGVGVVVILAAIVVVGVTVGPIPAAARQRLAQ